MPPDIGPHSAKDSGVGLPRAVWWFLIIIAAIAVAALLIGVAFYV